MLEKKAVIYTRVSDPSQIDNNSLDTQEKECKKSAETKGYEVIKIFREEGKSAKHIYTRPQLRELFNFCSIKKNNISAVFVYKSDRFSRNVEEGLAAISRLAKYGVEVISVIEGYENDPIGRAIRTIIMAMDQLDNEMKGERVKDNMQAVFKKGYWVFKCPVGYRRKYKTREQNKGLPPIKDENLAPIIERMFKKAATGIYSKSQLARQMNLEGFADFYQSKASHKIIDKILTKTFYFGKMYADKWKEYSWGKHEPIIDQATWEQAYNKVIMKKKNYSFQDETFYPFKGSLKCELCGHNMTTSPSRGNSGNVFYYECGNRGCRKVRIQSKVAHSQFLKILHKIKPNERVVDLFTSAVFNDWDKIINSSKKEAERIEAQIVKLKDELKSIRKSKDEGIYSTEEARDEAEKVRQEIALLGIEKADVRIDQYDAEIVSEFIKDFFLNLDRLWDKLSIVKKQALQNKIFPNGIVCTKDKEIRTSELSPSFQLIEALKAEKGQNVIPQRIELWLPG